MGTAVAKQQKDKKSAVELLVEEFEKDYAEAWAEVQVAEATTNTTGWLEWYAGEVRRQREVREKVAKKIDEHVHAFRTWGSNEESEKELGEIKKMEVELRERREGWEAIVVSPWRQAVDRCNALLSSFQSKAQDIAREAPLVHKDAPIQMSEAQRAVGRATWNEEEGRVRIKGLRIDL